MFGIKAMFAVLAQVGTYFTNATQAVESLPEGTINRRQYDFGDWLQRKLRRQEMRRNVRCAPKPGFVVSIKGNGRVLGRAVAPWMPNKKGFRIEHGKYIPRHA